MRKIIFIGRSEAGKTTLTQAMKGKKIVYHKTQYINHYDVIIDTPGEYAETKELAGSLAVYSAEADVVGLLISATEPFSLYPPNVTAQANREVVGIVTKCDHWAGNPEQAAEWLRLAGCKKIFMTSSFTGEGIADIISYLKEEHETLPWEEVKRSCPSERPRTSWRCSCPCRRTSYCCRRPCAFASYATTAPWEGSG